MTKVLQKPVSPQEINALFTSALATVLAAVYWLSRSGFDDNSLILVLKVLSLSYFLLFFPVAVRMLLAVTGKLKQDAWFNSHAWLLFCGTVLIVLAGFMQPYSRLTLLPFFSFIGILSVAVSCIHFFMNTTIKRVVIVAFSGILFSLWVAKSVWGVGYHSPLFIETIAVGRAHIDTLFHATISHMIQTYGIPSTGLDGIHVLSYHFGSHWIFAQISNLLNISPLLFYQIGYQLIFIPLLLNSLVMFVITLKKVFGQQSENWDIASDIRFWLILMAAFVGFLPASISEASVMWNGILVSESYCIALTFAFITVSLLLHMHGLIDQSLPKNQLLFVLFILPLLIAIITALKVSVGFLCTLLILYMLVRLQFYKKNWGFLSLVLVLFTGILTYMLIKPNGSGGAIAPFHFIKEFVIPAVPHLPPVLAVLFFLIFHYFWTWSYVLLRMKRYQALRPAGSVMKTNWAFIDLEAVAVLSLAGLLPGALLAISGGSAFYFSDVQTWFSLSLFLAVLPLSSLGIGDYTKKIFSSLSIKRFIAAGLFIFFAIFFLVNLISSYNKLLVSNLAERYSILYGSDFNKKGWEDFNRIKSELFTANYSLAMRDLQERVAFLKDQPQKSLNGNKRYWLVKTLQAQAQATLEEKRKSLLYITKSNRCYWDMAPYKTIPFVGPALSGIAMIRGLPELREANGYGYESYNLTDERRITPDPSPDTLNAEARSLGFSKLIVMSEDTITNINLKP